jgi:hypothetical protein
MLSGIFLKHHKGLKPGLPYSRMTPGNKVAREENEHDDKKFDSFFHNGFS